MEQLDNRPGLHKRQLTQETMTKSGLIEDCQNCREPGTKFGTIKLPWISKGLTSQNSSQYSLSTPLDVKPTHNNTKNAHNFFIKIDKDGYYQEW
jgi:hypothetical protein